MPDHPPAHQSAGPTHPVSMPAQPAGGPRVGAARVHSQQLFNAAQELEIVHGRDIYRLRITSLGRLILTK